MTVAIEGVCAQRALVRALESAGWRLRAVEIDTHRATARVELVRADGLLVTLDARDGRASITREMTDREVVAVGRRGDRSRAERLHMRFVGRSRHEGVRSALRSLCNYVEDNAPVGKLPRSSVRALFAPLMGAG